MRTLQEIDHFLHQRSTPEQIELAHAVTCLIIIRSPDSADRVLAFDAVVGLLKSSVPAQVHAGHGRLQ
jgi:hypothetical protein